MRKRLKQKKVLFPLIFLAELIVIVTIANIFDLETDNTLYGGVSVCILGITIILFLVRIIKDHKKELAATRIPIIGGSALIEIYFITGLLIFLLAIIFFDILRVTFGS